jgi:hypothetical protein
LAVATHNLAVAGWGFGEKGNFVVVFLFVLVNVVYPDQQRVLDNIVLLEKVSIAQNLFENSS